MSSVAADAIGSEIAWEASVVSEWRLLDQLEKTAIGKRGGDWITTVRRREPAGCLLYGPYWQLPSGSYRLNFCCRSGRPRMLRQPVLGVEVIAMNRLQLAWRDFTSEELQAETGSLDFSVPPVLALGAGDEARLEFRFFHLGNADLAITTIDLRQLERDSSQPNPPTRWRMLGRLEEGAIGKRDREGVKISRGARAGYVLHGGRPLLQLPKGRYRLSVSGEGHAQRSASQPVLGVEIVAQRRWQDEQARTWRALLGLQVHSGLRQAWRDFTAAELSSGSASIDFAVPGELSLEGGQEVLFGFRFLYLGHGELTLTAADLEQVSDEQVDFRQPREWRLLDRLVKGRIGVRAADGVSVRQAERAGILLYSGRPQLRLSAGRYHLVLCCRTGLPRIGSQPVLGLEISVARTWFGACVYGSQILLNRTFTSETLRGGPVSVDFEVPQDFSGLAYTIKFFHLGNADLAISEVRLHGTTSEEARQAAGAAMTQSPALITGKTNVIIIGNCQAQTVYEALMRTKAFNTKVNAKYHFVGLQQNLHDMARSELANCELLLVQEINDWANYPLRAEIREDLPIIKFPLLHLASLWPFDQYNGPGDREAYEREAPNLTFLYLDGLLGRLRKEIPDREQRLLAYRSLSIDGVVNYVRLHDFERRRLLAMDRQFGFEIGDFILRNFQRKRLFYTTNHPNGKILAMLLQHLLKYLGIAEACRTIASLDHLKRLQVPVHPKVAEALGVKWASESTKYLYRGERITWETYVRRYIEHYG